MGTKKLGYAGVRRPGGARFVGAAHRLSRVTDEGAVLCPVRLGLQLTDRLRGAAFLRACHVLRLRGLRRRPPRQGWHREPALLVALAGMEVAPPSPPAPAPP